MYTMYIQLNTKEKSDIMAKKPYPFRFDDKTVEKLDLLVKRENAIIKQLADSVNITAKPANRTSILVQLIDIAYNKVDDTEDI